MEQREEGEGADVTLRGDYKYSFRKCQLLAGKENPRVRGQWVAP